MSLDSFNPVDELYYSSPEVVQVVAQSADKTFYYGGLAKGLYLWMTRVASEHNCPCDGGGWYRVFYFPDDLTDYDKERRSIEQCFWGLHGVAGVLNE